MSAPDNITSTGIGLTRYRIVAWCAFVSLYIIIVTGSLVRLTGSGLGCVDWPACNEERFVDVTSTHAAIEQINRLFTGVVAASVIVAALAALAIRPRNRQIGRFASLLVVGVIGQVVLGGIVVLTGLHPLANMGHFVLSVLLMTWAYWLLVEVRRARDGRPFQLTAEPVTTLLVRGLVVLVAIAIVTGTVVTGSGPHAGDETAMRFPFLLTTVARIHGGSVLVTLVCAVLLGVLLRGSTRVELRRAFETFLFVALLQAGVGYLQYFTGVPILLVAVHIALSIAVWLCALRLNGRLYEVVAH